MLIFLGLLLDTENQVVRIPADKICKAMEMIDYFLDRQNKKVTILQVQKLCGFLNFLCRCIVPGRVFTARLYSLTAGTKLKPHHHVRVKEENRLDLMVWREFLSWPDVFCIPFAECGEIKADEVNMYSDALGKIGFGAICNTSWMFGQWSKALFIDRFEPSIEYLELFALMAGMLTWLHRFKNKKIILFCDNISVVHMINNTSSRCKNCMVLLRLVVLHSMKCNVRLFAKYVRSKDNGLGDALSRLDFQRFRKLGPNMERRPTEPPADIWPVERIWVP